jgi:SAM-dependent methyltransferase
MSDHFPTPRGMHYLAAPVLPSSPSTISADDSSPTTSSNPWNRVSVMTDNTEFEDIYDVSDQEEYNTAPRRQASLRRKSSQVSSKQPARLVIPASDDWAAVTELKKMTSPVQLTPSAKLTMSPAQMNFMDQQQALEVPTISAPPSLDGSLSSEQLAAMSAPATPVIGNDEVRPDEAWSGVQLQPNALATLHALSNNNNSSSNEDSLHEQPSQVLEAPEPPRRAPEMQQQQQQRPLRLITSFGPSAAQLRTNSKRQSLAGLTKLDIPSPGGFFSGLSPRTRNTWHIPSKTPEDVAPPTSTTAEQFYRCPWNADSSIPPVPALPKRQDSFEGFYRNIDSQVQPAAPVEQVVEVRDDFLTDDMPTARPIIDHRLSGSAKEADKAPASPDAEGPATEIVVDYDPNYARKQQQETLSNLDRTGLWLVAQRAYLKGVEGLGITNDESSGALKTIAEDLDEEEAPAPKPVVELALTLPKKKTVRFSDIITNSAPAPKRLPSKLLRQESAYYRAFQDYIIRTQQRDVFVHQHTRFEAIQAQRVSLREAHRSQLLGKYQLSVVPQSAKKRLSANVARGDDVIIDDHEKIRKEKEFEAMEQMTVAMWHVAAMKFLNGGRLITAPVTKRLARLSRMVPGQDGLTRDRARILDLGGQAACDWAWHCALQYPNTKVYTVTTKAIRQLSNSNIRGPSNHRLVAVERLTRLPFADNQFDLISARELHSVLKLFGENGEDEWETCVKECMRVLKPGGYLEFSLLDSDIMNAGPLGLAKSVEFGFTLKTLGYDPSPSKMWLGRLARAGFEDVRRIWMCLPMAAQRAQPPPSPPLKQSPTGEEARVCQMEAMLTGSTDAVANACSVVGGWSWERWLLRCEMEKVAGELRLADTVTTGAAMEEAGKCLDGVHSIMEEGRNCSAGYRMLNGYAMKPRVGTELIQIALAE